MTAEFRPGKGMVLADAVPGEPLIVFQNVRLGFDEADVLQGISFEVEPGETKVLLGESGSGKTLVMKLAAGLMRPDSGEIWVMGRDLNEMSEPELLDFRRHLGFVFQEGALFDSMTVADNVAFRLHEEHVAEEEIDKSVKEALTFVEMAQADAQAAIQALNGQQLGGRPLRINEAQERPQRPRQGGGPFRR